MPVAGLIANSDNVAKFIVESLPAAYIKRPVESIAIEVAAIPDVMAKGESEIGDSAPVFCATAKIPICGVVEDISVDAVGANPET